jgi:hypothetical protein
MSRGALLKKGVMKGFNLLIRVHPSSLEGSMSIVEVGGIILQVIQYKSTALLYRRDL